jgi:hypothetical protein
MSSYKKKERSDSTKRHSKKEPLTRDDISSLERETEKKYNKNNSDQQSEIVKLSKIFKSVMKSAENDQFKNTCTEGLEYLRDYTTRNKENSWSPQEKSDNLHKLYTKISELMEDELEGLNESEQESLREIDGVVIEWHGLVAQAMGINYRRESDDVEKQERERENLQDVWEETKTLNWTKSKMRLTVLLQRLKQARTQDPYLTI